MKPGFCFHCEFYNNDNRQRDTNKRICGVDRKIRAKLYLVNLYGKYFVIKVVQRIGQSHQCGSHRNREQPPVFFRKMVFKFLCIANGKKQ